jgi:hypothetical protein
MPSRETPLNLCAQLFKHIYFAQKNPLMRYIFTAKILVLLPTRLKIFKYGADFIPRRS